MYRDIAKVSFGIFFNAIYKINKFKMPFFIGIVVIFIKIIANIMYSFINNECFEGFNRIVTNIEWIYI